MTVEEFLDRLESVRRRYGYWMSRCPAHEDRVQSLSIYPNDSNWGFGWKCHAGCKGRDVWAAWRELSEAGGGARGILGSKPLPDPASESPRPADIAGFEAVYDYRDEGGRLLYVVCRTRDKRFLQARHDPESPTGYYWGLNGTRRVPYHLSQLLPAVKWGETVYVVEGEKDVHAVERAGGAATCNPMGAGEWREEWGSYFIGAKIVVVPDQDKAGREHAEAVALSLIEYAEDVVLAYPRAGKDVSDHLEAGYTLEDLVA